MFRLVHLTMPALLVIFVPSRCIAQNQHTNWYFGSNAGLTFSGGAPAAFTGSAINAFEGCTSISDSSGMGLFYTDGETIYDRSNTPMPNGTGMGGNLSSAQGVVIVPFPGNAYLYYLFTVPSQVGQFSGNDHMTWSVIDMSLNGGYGDVTLKNLQLFQGSTEQLTATYHANGRDVWVLARKFGTDEWYAYLVTCGGISEPVVSHAGQVVMDSNPNDTQAALGCMDVSYAGDRIASTWNDSPGDLCFLELLDFDNSTGAVTNGIFTTQPGQGGSSWGYGVAFSPNGGVLYWSNFGYPNSPLYQYDLNASNPFGTELLIGELNAAYFGGMQIGLDGKLYIARWDAAQKLAQVNFPDIVGSGCGFILDGVSIAPGYCTLSLSNDWMRETPPMQELISWEDTTTCADNILVAITAQFGNPAPTFLWSNGETSSSIVVDQAGVYSVMVIFTRDTLRDSVNVSITAAEPFSLLEQDTLAICRGEEIELHGPSGFESYLWNDGGTGMNALVREAGEVWLLVRDSLGCSVSDTVIVELGPCECELFIPNVFTPNGDGNNDRFLGSSACVLDEYELRIFNRWGQEIFFADRPNIAWDGSGSPDGVYIWSVRYTTWNGDGNDRHVKYGMVTLLR
ncbi:MAG: gliding motility-associated C-terminal domain-containing protein [Flavobacteriales bacterium]|nr:gliding motility-associated C-terminal domain-containing protein [Flavobacteriales bacterium]